MCAYSLGFKFISKPRTIQLISEKCLGDMNTVQSPGFERCVSLALMLIMSIPKGAASSFMSVLVGVVPRGRKRFSIFPVVT